jgi:hypothetical protein
VTERESQRKRERERDGKCVIALSVYYIYSDVKEIMKR